MKTTRYFFLMLHIVLFAICAEAQQRNILQVPDINVQIGNAQLPISIENTDEIVGAQFDLTLPDGVTADPVGTLGNRSDGHSVTVSQLANGAYRVLLHSAQNRPLRGQSGVVMYLPINIPTSYEEGSEHALSITNALLGKATGENVLTDVMIGKIHVSKLPDLTVKNITFDKQALNPGDRLVASWQVENIGELATNGGWSEQVSLISEDSSQSKLIATAHYDGILDACGIVSRQVEVTLPALLGIDGQTRLQVQIVPDSNTGESASSQGNNIQTANALLFINKVLTLELSPNRVVENSGARIKLKLNRSGNWTEAETFTLTATSDSRITVPASVTIPAGQSGAIVYISLTDNDVLDDESTVTVSAEGNGYAKVSQQLFIEDNEYPNLTVVASKSVITEGETFQLTITASRASAAPLTVTLTSENYKRFTFPQTLTIPAGETSTIVTVETVDDELPSLELSNAFTASAPSYNKGEVIVLLQDNDMPVLELTLTPNTVSEGVGPVAVAGVLRRTTNTNSKITVKLADDANGGLYFGNRTLELAKGVQEVHFNFGPVDNAQVDGDRIYTITAAVWLSSCSCNASGESAGYVTAKLNVLDNDGPALSLSSSLSTVKEGDVTTLTITRNTTDTTTPLTVNISSDYDEGLTYDHIVTIPIGQQYVKVNVASGTNGIQGDSHTVVFTVQAEGYSTGTCYVMVTDQTLPDAVIDNIEIKDSEVEAGAATTLSITLTNRGSAELPSKIRIDLYLQNDKNPFSTIYSQTPIAPGETAIVTDKVTMPNIVGSHLIYGIVNDSRSTQELLYTNNTSNTEEIQLLSPYTATVKSNKDFYLPNETIILTGVVEGKAKGNTEVEIYLINDDARQSFTVRTNENGEFALSYKPHERQMGHFVIGACYPNSGQTTEQDSFEYIGLRRTSRKYITCEVIVGTPYQGVIQIENPNRIAQHNILTEILEKPDNCDVSVSPINEIASGEKSELHYTINGLSPSQSSEWKNIKIRLESNEGASTEVILYSLCRLPQAQLSLDIKQLNTTITKGVPREYPISITNTGAGETGQISLSMPSVLQGTAVTSFPSLKPNETTTITLHLETTEDMSLNVPVTGMIGVNCENGNGVGLPFNLLPVSDTKGVLVIDVCDEYTYYTTEAPHVKGAKVTLKHPYSDKIIVEGVTDDDGIFSTVLPEGYYAISVSADKHESYKNNVLIDPGMETRKVVDLSYEAIKVEWKVEETEVEDEYDIQTTLTYETNVPVPVVITQLPEYIPVDSIAPGESRIYYATLTNKGLIAAEGAQLNFPNVEFLTFETLIEFPVRLLPQQSVVVPFKVTLAENVLPVEDDVPSRMMAPMKSRKWKIVCETNPKTLYFWICGSDHHKKFYETPIRLKENCHVVMTERKDSDEDEKGGIPDGRGGFLWFGGSGGSKGTPVVDDKECMTCWEVLRDKAIDELIDMIPYVGCWINSYRCSKEEVEKATNGELPDLSTLSCIADAAECAMEDDLFTACTAATEGAGVAVCWGLRVLKNIRDILSDLSKCMGFEWRTESRRRIAPNATLSMALTMDEKSNILIGQLDALLDYYEEFFGDETWLNVSFYDLWSLCGYISNQNGPVGISELKDYKPENITDKQFNAFINRINNSFLGGNDVEDNRIDFTKLRKCIDLVLDTENKIIQEGYESSIDMWLKEYAHYREILNNGSSSVCTHITLQIDQIMTLTRPAYRGTLTVFNGNEETAMTDVRLNFVVKDEDGIVANEKFEIHAEADGLEGFEGEATLPGNWTLDAKQTGKATVLFIPTRYAAPTEEKVYSFGGTLTYIDPFTGLEVSRSLVPVSLTVKPLPDLELTYLMQRDVYGDDPLTSDVVEPMVPAEFALIIDNKGYGEAKNVRMLTQQPKIIDNEKGLLIDFNIKSSQVNGEVASLSFGQSIANNFGTIPAHSQAYTQWWLESSLLGHFTSYEVEATHVTSYGNEDLSLLDTVTIHEMIHGFTVKHDGDKPLRGYLVNDIVDADDMPDILYFTDATQQGVYLVKEQPQINRLSDTEYVLTVKADNAGWNYGSVFDPTNGRQKLVKVVRGDGTEVNVDNVWQTDRTLRDGRDWLYENRLHFVGNMPAEGETFYLTFEPKPELELAVESYAGVPEENTVLKEQLTAVTVKFNKPIKADSFTTDDISLNCQGEPQDLTKIVIDRLNEQEYKLTLNETTLLDGYYVLTVQTAGIEDTEGFNGATGKQVSWIQYVDGMVALKVTASPVEGGTVIPTSGRFAYDSNVTLKATPAEGYDFVGWKEGDATISTDREFAYHLVSATELKALFSIKHYNVTIGYDPTQGTVEGAATGIYEHGTQLQLTAVPATDYEFDAWMIGDERETKESSFILTVNRNMDVSALFKEKKDVPTCLQNIDGNVLRVNIEPLPLSNYMYITGNFKEIRNVFIYDIRGIKVLGEGDVQSGQGIYVGKLNKGIYYMQIATDRGVYRTKVLKK